MCPNPITTILEKNLSVSVDLVKCACADCVCVVSTANAVEAEGRIFCGENCATHHEAKAGCDHTGCPCHG